MLFIFDMGGVVTNTFELDSMVKQIGISKEDFWNICKNGQRNFWDEFQKGLIGINEFWTLFNENSEKYNFKKVMHDYFRLNFNPVRKNLTVEMIQKLKQKHRVVCGTNTIQSHYENHMECGDYLIFNKTYASNKIQAIKPDSDFFQLIMNAEGFLPSETFFVDDKIENCEAAKKIGINTVHFICEKDLYDEWKKYF